MSTGSEKETQASIALRLYTEHLEHEQKGEFTQASKKLESSCKLGEPLAFHARAYELYNSEIPDIRGALDLYRRAAKKGFGPSMWNLARHYELFGSVRQYFHWLNAAAEIGDEDAAKELNSPFPYLLKKAAQLLDSGDLSAGVKALKRASDGGSEEAKALIGKMDQFGRAIEQ